MGNGALPDWPWAPALVALCCCLGALPLVGGNPPATSDGLYHLLRSAELAHQLQAGIAYPRWAPDFYLGYGYPIFLFTPLLPYYLVVAVHTLGMALQPAMNVVEAAALAASGLFTYAWLRRSFAPSAAAIGAVLYVLAPYHLVNVYYRGDLSEFLAATWFPAILLALSMLLQAPTPRRALVLALPAAALLLTHFISALLFLPVVTLLALAGVSWRQPRCARTQVACAGGAALLAVALSAVSWLPAVAYAGDATFAKLLRFYNYRQNFASFGQLFSLAPLQHYTAVFAGSRGFGYQFGLLQSVALLAGMLAWLLHRRWSDANGRAPTVALALIAVLSLAGCLRVSAPLWSALPPLQLVQFPWRFLAIAALPAAYFGALAVDALSRRLRPVAGGAATIVVVASCLLLLAPSRIALSAGLSSATGIARFEVLYHLAGTSAAAEYLPPWASERQTTSAEAFALATGSAPPADPAAGIAHWIPSDRQQFTIQRSQSGDVVLPVLFFPGWQALVDGQVAALHPAAASGLITLPLEAGTHTVVLHYRDPPQARLGTGVSLLALFAVLGLAAFGLAPGARRLLHRAAVSGAHDRIVENTQEIRPERGRPARPRRLLNSRALYSEPPCIDGRTGAGGTPALRPGEAGSLHTRVAIPRSHTAGNMLLSLQYPARPALIVVPVAAALLVAALGGRTITAGWQALDANLAGGIHLAGYALKAGTAGPAPEVTATAGHTVQLQLRGTSSSGRQMAVQLTDAAATDWADWQAGLGAGTTTVPLALPATLPPGLYSLRLGSVAAGGPAEFALQDAQLVRLLPVDGTLLVGPLVVTAPAGAAAALPEPLAIWPGQAALGNVRLPATIRAGETLAPAWTWHAPVYPAAVRLTETVHLVDAAGHVLAAADTEPAAGYYPTPFWQPNELVRDHLLLRLPADIPPGPYALRVGLRQGGAAIPAQDAAGDVVGDDIAVGQVTVLPPSQPAAWDGEGIAVGPLQVELAQPLGKTIPGRTLTVTLRWHRGTAPPQVSAVTLLLRRGGQSLGSVAAGIGGPAYPAASWRAGETEIQAFDLPVVGNAPAGPADLAVAVYSDGMANPPFTTLATVNVAGRPHVYTAQPATPTAVTFANGIQMLGYDLKANGILLRQPAVTARRTLDVTLYWKAAGPTAQPLKVTLQLLSSANHLLAQADTEPGNGAAPTTGWLPGEIVTSEHHLVLAGLPPGVDHLIVALYDPQTNQRIQTGGADAATLTTVTLP